jgi:hypothetical protein
LKAKAKPTYIFHKYHIRFREELGIKTISFVMIIVLMMGSTFAFAEVDDKSPAREAALDSVGSFSPKAMSLVDMGPSPVASSSDSSFAQGCNKNMLWILDPTCLERHIDFRLPLGRFGALELAPGTSGYAMLFHRIPYGDLQVRYMGYVYAGHRYRLSLCADSMGSHELWYRIGWQESNRVRMDVFGRG